eukprot:1191227-Prorocentrum_minimum.AAC.2
MCHSLIYPFTHLKNAPVPFAGQAEPTHACRSAVRCMGRLFASKQGIAYERQTVPGVMFIFAGVALVRLVWRWRSAASSPLWFMLRGLKHPVRCGTSAVYVVIKPVYGLRYLVFGLGYGVGGD